jgi:polysaccharide export outer membrane protein
MHRPRLATVLLLGLLIPAARSAAQQLVESDPGRILANRQGLQDLLGRLDLAASSPAYSGRIRAQAVGEASLIRTRLAEGDFQVGDRLVMVVEGERELTDSFTVQAGRILTLPTVGPVPLQGVLRAELESHLTTVLARFLRDPVVHARSLMPLSILGEVVRPGFYTVPTEIPLTAALMQAEGPTRDAKLTEIRIERDGRHIWEGPALQQAITEGRTLDQLNLRAGDQVVVPRAGHTNLETLVRVVSLVITIPAAIYGLTRLTH